MSTYIVTLTYTVPQVQNGQANIGQINIQPYQSPQYQQAVEIITADNFELSDYGVTFFNNDSDKLAFFPIGQYRSVKKNG